MTLDINDKLKAIFWTKDGQLAKFVVNPDGTTATGPSIEIASPPDLSLNDLQSESIIPASSDPDQFSQAIVTL